MTAKLLSALVVVSLLVTLPATALAQTTPAEVAGGGGTQTSQNQNNINTIGQESQQCSSRPCT